MTLSITEPNEVGLKVQHIRAARAAGTVWYGIVDVCDGYLAAEASGPASDRVNWARFDN